MSGFIVASFIVISIIVIGWSALDAVKSEKEA